VSISQITVPDSLKIAPAQVKNIYIGLKRGEVAQQRLDACYLVVTELNEIIQEQNKFLQFSLTELSRLNADLAIKNNQLMDSAVKMEKLKKTKWYRHPITWSIVGLVGGILIAK
jgi:hypothetical protein